MEREKLSKRQITSLIIGVLSLVILVTSATYAYFSVTAGNSSGTTTITGDIGGDTLGTVTLTGGNTELYLGISAYDMSENKIGTTYYSSTTEGSRETNVNSAGKTTYTATLSGDDTGELMYACDYEFTITKSGSMPYSSALNLVFEGDINQTVTLYSSKTVSGTFRKITSSNPTREFSAYLQLANTDSNQNSLAGKNLSVEIKNTKWKCYLLDDSDLVGEAYALLTYDDEVENSSGDVISAYNLTFVRSETPINVGDLHNGAEVTEVYTGFESSNIVPWSFYNITNVVFEDEIRPMSTADWFNGAGDEIPATIDLTNLNTSNVTNMSGMFAFTARYNTLDITGWENIDTSNANNMSDMFYDAAISIDVSGWNTSKATDMSDMFSLYQGNRIDLSKWDVSNVTNMSSMFYQTYIYNIGDISNWDVSNVTNMSDMFSQASFRINFNLSGWDVSSVTNMSSMFYDTSLYTDLSNWNVGNVTDMSSMFKSVKLYTNLNLSSWNVSKVTNYSNFSSDLYIDEDVEEGPLYTFTPPKWSTT